MSIKIKTLDGGEIRAGFFGPDISKILLGDLPPMATPQFMGYAAFTLATVVAPRLDMSTRQKWAGHAQRIYEGVRDLPLMRLTGENIATPTGDLGREFTNNPDNDDAVVELIGRTAGGGTADYYRVNPFHVDVSGTAVGFSHENVIRHVVGREDFFAFTLDTIDGGFSGWGPRGTYPEAKMAAALLATALGNSTPPQIN